MITERKLQAGLEAAGEELSQYAYLLDSVEQGKLDGGGREGLQQKRGSHCRAALCQKPGAGLL